MAKHSGIKIGTAQDVFHDDDFQKQVQPELDVVVAKIDQLGLHDDYTRFLASRNSDEIVAQKTVSFVEQFNSEIDGFRGVLDDISSGKTSIFATVKDNLISNSENIVEVDNKYFFKDSDNNDALVEISRDVIIDLATIPETAESCRLEINNDTIEVYNSSETSPCEVFERNSSGEYEPTINGSRVDTVNKIDEELSNDSKVLDRSIAITNHIDISDLSDKIDELKGKSDKIEAVIDKANNYSYLDHKNIFAQYTKLEAMIVARENGMKFEGGYVAKGDIYLATYKLVSGFSFDSLLRSYAEILVYKYLDKIENAQDMERFRETGSVDKPEETNKPEIEKNNNDTPLEVGVDKSNADNTDNKETDKSTNNDDHKDPIERTEQSENRSDIDTPSFKIGNLEIDKDTKINKGKNELYSKNEKISLSDVKDKINGIDVAVTRNFTDRNTGEQVEYTRANIVPNSSNNVVVNDKIVLEIRGRDNIINISDTNKAHMTREGDSRVAGVDRDTTLGYQVYDLNTGKVEYLNCRFEHIGGEKLGVEPTDLRLTNEQRELLMVDSDIGDAFTDKIVDIVSPEDKETQDKIEIIQNRIDELTEMRDSEVLNLTDNEKDEIDKEIERLNQEKDTLSQKDDPDKTSEERIEINQEKSEIIKSDITVTQTEKDHKDEIDKIKLDKLESKVKDFEGNISNGIDITNSRSGLMETRREYIESSSLSEKDKDTLKNAVRVDVSDVDKRISGASFDDKEKVTNIIQALYGRDLETTPIESLTTDVCKDASVSIKESIESKTQEIDKIKEEFGKATDSTSLDLETFKNGEIENTSIARDADGNVESITVVSKESIDSDNNGKFDITRTEVLSFDEKGNCVHSDVDLEIKDLDGNVITEHFEENFDIDVHQEIEVLDDKGTEEYIHEETAVSEVANETTDNSDKIDAINEGIDKAIEEIKNDDSISDNAKNAISDSIEKHKDNIFTSFDKNIENTPRSDDVKQVVVEAIKFSGVDMDSKSSRIKGFFDSKMPIERIIDRGFEGKNINNQQLSKDDNLKQACDTLIDNVQISSLIDKDSTASENIIDISDTAKSWLDADISEKDKIEILDAALNDTITEFINEGVITQDQGDIIYSNLELDLNDPVVGFKEDNSPEDNAKIYSDFMDRIVNDGVSNEEITIPGSMFVEQFSIDFNSETNDKTDTEKYDFKPIESYESREELINKQDRLTTSFIEGDFSTSDYIGGFMAIEGEARDEDGNPYNESTIPDENGNTSIINIENRITESIDAIVRYAESHPDKIEEVANAITKIAVDTGCVSKITEAADDKLSGKLSVEEKDTIMEVCFSQIDDIIDNIYGIDRDEDGNIVDIELNNDNVENIQNQVIDVVSGIVEAMLSKDDTKIKEKIADVLEKTKSTISSDPMEAKKEFLIRIKNAIEGIADRIVDYNNNDTEFDVDDIDLDKDNEYESIEDTFNDYEKDENNYDSIDNEGE